MSNKMENIWIQMEEVHQAFVTLVGEFKAGNRDERLALIQIGYKNRALAVAVLEYLDPEDLKELLPFLMEHVRSVHGYIGHLRRVILSLPKEWLVNNIENTANPILTSGGEEEYRRFLELYEQIDNTLARRLAQRAAESSNNEIRETGEEFLEKLA